MAKLTDAKVAALKPRAKRYLEPDSTLPAFYCRVTPNGAKTFCCVARDPAGKQIWTTIGPTHLYTVEQARERARATLKEVRLGEGTGPETFGSVARKWLKRHVDNPKRQLRSKPEIERLLNRHILPRWEGRDFATIKRLDVADLLDIVEDKHGARQADYCLQIISGIANWYAKRHNTYSSPIVKGMRRTDPAATKRKRILDDDEIRAVWAACEGTYGDLVKVALLTGQRREKLVTMRWRDISDDGVWTIPTEEREKGNPGELVLPDDVLEIIRARPRYSSNPFVFAAAHGRGHFKGFSKCKTALDKQCGIAPWQFHDLRRTAKSLMARAGVRPDISERVLGHVIGGVQGIYDRHHYRDEKAGALAALASLLGRILNPPADNVTSLRRVG